MAYKSIYNNRIFEKGKIENFEGKKIIRVTDEMCDFRGRTWCQNNNDLFALLTTIFPGDVFFVTDEKKHEGYVVAQADFIHHRF